MKEELRYKYKIKRKYFQNSAREVADGAILDCFLQAFGDREKYFIYNSFSSEADTHAIISALRKLNKFVCLPRVEGDKMVMAPAGETKVGAFGIEEPLTEEYSGEIDVMVLPLLAVNGKGYRLGYGKGYYDKFIKEHPEQLKNCVKVGLGYNLQYTDEFVADEWDEPIDYFVCERGIYSFEKHGQA